MAIYAIDFDNTLAITRFPEIVAPNKKMVAFAKAVKAQGHQIILWTSRAGADLENAVEWCRLQGLVFDAVDRAYMIGYTDAMNQERSHRRAARERRERKKYFAMQKLNGVALLIFTAVAIKILEGDATIAFITVPLGLSMLLSKEMLIINKYYWKCEEKAERGVQ